MTYHNHKQFVCPYCGRDFAKKRQIKSHMKNAHSGKDKETPHKDKTK